MFLHKMFKLDLYVDLIVSQVIYYVLWISLINLTFLYIHSALRSYLTILVDGRYNPAIQTEMPVFKIQ